MLEESQMEGPGSAEIEADKQSTTENGEEKEQIERKSLSAELIAQGLGAWNKLYTSTVGKSRSSSVTSEQAAKTEEVDSTDEKSENSSNDYWTSAQNMLRTGASSIQKYSAQAAVATRTAAEAAYETVSVQSAVAYDAARSTLGNLEARMHSPADNLNKLTDGLHYDNLKQEEGAIE